MRISTKQIAGAFLLVGAFLYCWAAVDAEAFKQREMHLLHEAIAANFPLYAWCAVRIMLAEVFLATGFHVTARLASAVTRVPLLFALSPVNILLWALEGGGRIAAYYTRILAEREGDNLQAFPFNIGLGLEPLMSAFLILSVVVLVTIIWSAGKASIVSKRFSAAASLMAILSAAAGMVYLRHYVGGAEQVLLFPYGVLGLFALTLLIPQRKQRR